MPRLGAAPISTIPGSPFAGTAEIASGLLAVPDSNMCGQGSDSGSEQHPRTRSALLCWAAVCKPRLVGFTQHSALQSGLAGAIPTLSMQIAITNVKIFQEFRKNK